MCGIENPLGVSDVLSIDVKAKSEELTSINGLKFLSNLSKSSPQA